MRATLQFGQWMTIVGAATLLVISNACSDAGTESTPPPEEDTVTASDTVIADVGVPDGAPEDVLVADTSPPKPPPGNGSPWSIGDCADSLTGTGTKKGQIAYDFIQPDQYGNPLRLHDFCDRVVLVVGAAFW
jgi:hypothetical protein